MEVHLTIYLQVHFCCMMLYLNTLDFKMQIKAVLSANSMLPSINCITLSKLLDVSSSFIGMSHNNTTLQCDYLGLNEKVNEWKVLSSDQQHS